MKKAPVIIAVIAACAVAVALLVPGLAPSSCSLPQLGLPGGRGATAERAIEEGFETLTATSDENIRARLGEPLCLALEEAGIDPREVFDAFYGHISYDIDESRLPESGSSADVPVSATNIDIQAALESYNMAFNAWVGSSEYESVMGAGDDSAMWRKEVDLLKEAFDNPDLEVVTYALTAHLERDEGGAWQLTNEDALIKSLTGGVAPESLL